MAHAPDDELLSALLDGEPAPGDASHVPTCDVCQARLAELRHAASAMAAPITPPAGHIREAAVREALLVAADATRASVAARVLPFRRRASTATPSAARRASPLSATAALLVALLVGGWALSMVGRGGEGIDNTPGLQVDAAIGAGAFDLAGGRSQQTFAASVVGWYNAGDLGRVDSVDEFIRLASADLSQRDDDKAAHMSHKTEVPCVAPDDATLLWHGLTTYNGEAAVAQVFNRSATQWVMQIRATPECSLIASQAFAPITPR